MSFWNHQIKVQVHGWYEFIVEFVKSIDKGFEGFALDDEPWELISENGGVDPLGWISGNSLCDTLLTA